MTRPISLSLIAAAVLGFSTLGASAEGSGYGNPDLLIAPEDLIAAQGGMDETLVTKISGQPVLLIDVRPAEMFEAGHIPGAMQIDPEAVADPDAPVEGALKPVGELAEMLAGLGVTPEARIVYYDDVGGFHAARMFWLTEYLGHQNVSLLDGGLSAWRAAGGTVVPGPTLPAEPGAFTPAPMPRRIASADWILERRDAPDVVIVDVRPASAFAKGHIPWAVNIPWKGNLGANGRMKPADDLLRHFEAQGVTLDSNVAVHCQAGLASSHSYFTLRLLGHPKVRTYHRSWSEWGSAPELPKSGIMGG